MKKVLRKARYLLAAIAFVGGSCPIAEATEREGIPVIPNASEPKTATVPIATGVTPKTAASKTMGAAPKTALNPTEGLPKTKAIQPKPKQAGPLQSEPKRILVLGRTGVTGGSLRLGENPAESVGNNGEGISKLIMEWRKEPGDYASGAPDILHLIKPYEGDETFLGVLQKKEYRLALNSVWRDGLVNPPLYIELPNEKTLLSSSVAELAGTVSSPVASVIVNCRSFSCEYVIDELFVRVLFKAKKVTISNPGGTKRIEISQVRDEPFMIGGGFSTYEDSLVICNVGGFNFLPRS